MFIGPFITNVTIFFIREQNSANNTQFDNLCAAVTTTHAIQDEFKVNIDPFITITYFEC